MHRRLILIAVFLVTAMPALAQDGWAALEREGAIALMRHALAPGTGDPANFQVGDCATQRNLDAAGQAQATRIGQALRDSGIRFDKVWTSQWCRCRDTADLLGLGPVTDKPFLNSFFGDRAEGPDRIAALRAALTDLPPDARPVLVTHQVTITGLTGVYPRSGEIVVVQRGPDGEIEVTGRILIAP